MIHSPSMIREPRWNTFLRTIAARQEGIHSDPIEDALFPREPQSAPGSTVPPPEEPEPPVEE